MSLHGLEYGANFGYRGEVTIQLDISKNTKEIILNAYQLSVESAEVELRQQRLKASTITNDERSQRTTISFDEELESSPASLSIKFKGTINNVCCSNSSLLEKNMVDTWLIAYGGILPFSI